MGSLPWSLVTQVNVAFAGIDPSFHCAWMDMDASDTPDDSQTIVRAVDGLRRARDAHNPNVKLVLSVGGDGMSYRFSRATAQADSLQALASSCADMVRAYGLDGIDYDWEFPGRLGRANCPDNSTAPAPCYDRQNDPNNFTALLAATRQALPPASVLSAAVYVNAPDVDGNGDTDTDNNIAYDYAGLQRHLTSVNIMAYSIKGWAGDATTGHNAPLSRALASLQLFNQQGIDRGKLVLGVPYYGAVWTQVTSPMAGARGVVQGPLDYRSLVARYGHDPGCLLSRDSEGAYYYCRSGVHAQTWASVDDANTLLQKATHVRQEGYGGMMFWAWPGDTEQGELTRSLWDGLHGGGT